MPRESHRGEGGAAADPFAAFDSAMEKTIASLREEKVAPKREKKAVGKEVIAAATANVQTFEQMLQSGDFESILTFPFEMHIRSLAQELNKDLPPELDDNLKFIKGAQERLAKYKELPKEAQTHMQEAIAGIRQKSEAILKSWAELLAVWFKELAARHEFEMNATEKEIREILDSPIFSAKVSAEEETYEDFKERFVKEISETEAELSEKSARQRFWWSFFATRKGTKDTSGYYQTPAQESWARLQTQMSDGTLKEADLLSESSPSAEFIEKQKARPKIEETIHGVATIRESIRAFGEEKAKKIMEIIEKHCSTEEERQAALKYASHELPKWQRKPIERTIMSFAPDETMISCTLPQPLKEWQGSVPGWFLPVCREYNELQLFKELVLPSSGGGTFQPSDEKSRRERLEQPILMDQVLRLANKEQAFGGKTSPDIGSPTIEYSEIFVVMKSKVLDTLDTFDIDPELLIKAMGTVEVAKGTYDEETREDFLRLTKILKTVTGPKLNKVIDYGMARGINFDQPLTLYGSGQEKQYRRWQEKVAQRVRVARPTGRARVEEVIENNQGRYPINTVTDAVTYIDAVRAELVAALKGQAESQAAAGKAEQQARQQAGREKTTAAGLSRRIQELEKLLEQANDRNLNLDKVARETRGRRDALTLEKSIIETQKSIIETQMGNLRSHLLELAGMIDSGVGEAENIGGLMSAGKQRDALSGLLSDVKKRLEALGKAPR